MESAHMTSLSVLAGSLPVVSFGVSNGSVVATVSLNSSWREFSRRMGMLPTSLYDHQAAELHDDASARLLEHLAGPAARSSAGPHPASRMSDYQDPAGGNDEGTVANHRERPVLRGGSATEPITGGRFTGWLDGRMRPDFPVRHGHGRRLPSDTWRVERMERAAVPGDTRLLDVLLVGLSTRHGQRHPGGAIPWNGQLRPPNDGDVARSQSCACGLGARGPGAIIAGLATDLGPGTKDERDGP
jgi:hypothetical protein